MEKVTYKDKIRDIERRWATLDKDADSAAWTNLTIELYVQLFNPETARYFRSKLKSTGIDFSQVAKDHEDYLSEIWMEACRLYEPGKGGLFEFITNRLKRRIMDDARKKSGIAGVPRDERKLYDTISLSAEGEEQDSVTEQPTEWTTDLPHDGGKRDRVTLISSNASFDTGEEEIDMNILDPIAFDRYIQQGFEDTAGHLIMDAQLCELASQILHFMENHEGRKKSDRNRMFYELFYSADIINYLKVKKDVESFQHERDNMEAMHFPFTNFCTDRQQPYLDKAELTVRAILQKELAKQGETLPQDKVEKLAADKIEEKLGVPLQNEVFRGYLERVENDKVSSSLVSQKLKEYVKDMYLSLKAKDLSYAEIWDVR